VVAQAWKEKLTQDLSNVSATIRNNLISPIWKNEETGIYWSLLSFCINMISLTNNTYKERKFTGLKEEVK